MGPNNTVVEYEEAGREVRFKNRAIHFTFYVYIVLLVATARVVGAEDGGLSVTDAPVVLVGVLALIGMILLSYSIQQRRDRVRKRKRDLASHLDICLETEISEANALGDRPGFSLPGLMLVLLGLAIILEMIIILWRLQIVVILWPVF